MVILDCNKLKIPISNIFMNDDELSTGTTEEERDKATVAYNLHLLEKRLINNSPNLSREEQIALQGVLEGTRDDREESNTFKGLVLLYDSNTGKFEKPLKPFEDGNYSALRTWVKCSKEVGKGLPGDQFILLTKRWPNMPSPADYHGAISGQDAPLVDGPLIYPERLFSPLENSDQMGDPEPWGGHILNPHPGDKVVLNTIQKFNEKHGPSR